MDLSGWSLAGGATYTFPSGSIVPGGSYLVVAASPAALAAATGYSAGYGPFVGDLNTTGADLQLVNNTGRIMDEVDFGVGSEWPAAPNGTGVTLAKIDPGAGAQRQAELGAPQHASRRNARRCEFSGGSAVARACAQRIGQRHERQFLCRTGQPIKRGRERRRHATGRHRQSHAAVHVASAVARAGAIFERHASAARLCAPRRRSVLFTLGRRPEPLFDAPTVSNSPTGRQTAAAPVRG